MAFGPVAVDVVSGSHVSTASVTHDETVDEAMLDGRGVTGGAS